MSQSIDNQDDWISSLAGFLRRTDSARAVMWEGNASALSVATLGPVDEQALRKSLEETLANIARKSENRNRAPTPTGAAIPGLTVLRSDTGTILKKDHGCEEVTQLWTWRKIPWPTAEEIAGVKEHEDDEDWRKLALLAGACGIMGLAGFAVHLSGTGPPWLAPALYVISMICGGWNAGKEAGPGLLHGKLDIHFLMLAVAVGASLIGAFGEGALLLFLFSFAGALEHFALDRTRREIQSLFKLTPKTAILLDEEGGTERAVPVDEVKAGDRLLIRPGDTIPVDSAVVQGESAADESSLTGEAHPVDKRTGDELYSGTSNLWGAMEAICLKPASQSSLQKIIELIQRARHMRAPSQRFTDKFGPGYTLGVLGVTTLMFFVWWLAFDIEPFLNLTVEGTIEYSAFYRAMTLLVVASPCALVLSIPSAILAAIAWGARHGILFRGGAAIEQLAGIKVVALDKTGTLTTGDLSVVRIESFPPGRERDVAEMAFTLEQRASHPIARAIIRYGQSEKLPLRTIEGFRTLAGKGVQAEVDQRPCLLGRRELLEEGPLSEWVKTLPDTPTGLSEVWFMHGDLLGRILLEDQIRTESAGVIKRLHAAGLITVMLTGDRPEAAKAVARHLGLTEVRAGLSPEAKVAAVQELTRSGKRVAMVGDGINDAPSLAVADIAVAMGARGSDAALEQSDVILMNDRIENFYEAFRLSRRALRIIRQNLALSLGTIVIMVAAAIFGLVPISIGVLAHEGSTVVVCLNSMRLLRGRTLLQAP